MSPNTLVSFVSRQAMPQIIWCIMPITVALIFYFGLPPAPPPDTSSRLLLDRIRQIPETPVFYFVLAGFATLYLAGHQLHQRRLRDQLIEKQTLRQTANLSEHDWWILEQLRDRALRLRARADTTIIGVIALLLGGLYYLTFLAHFVPIFEQRDIEAEWRQDFAQRFGSRLQQVRQGLYWFHVADVSFPPVSVESLPLLPSPQLRLYRAQDSSLEQDTVLAIGGAIQVTTDNGLNWRQPDGLEQIATAVITARFNNNGRAGLLQPRDGPWHATVDGGNTWRQTTGLDLDDTAYIAGVGFSESAPRVIIGSDGTVFTLGDDGTTWSSMPLDVSDFGITATFNSDGTHGIIAPRTPGSVYVMNGVMNWNDREDLSSERIDAVRFLDDSRLFLLGGGSRGILLYNGTVEWSESSGLENFSSFGAIMGFSDDGRHGVLGSAFGGSVYITDDGADSWRESTPPDLQEGEYMQSVTFLEGAQRVFVSTMGSVYVWNEEEASWRPVLEIGEANGTRAPIVHSDGRHAVMTGRNGSAYITLNGGVTWRVAEGVGFNRSERLAAVGFGAEGARVIAGDQGTVYVRYAAGGWLAPNISELRGSRFSEVEGLVAGEVLGVDERGRVFLLKAYGDLPSVLSRMEPDEIMTEVARLPVESRLRAEIVNFLNANAFDATTNRNRLGDGAAERDVDGEEPDEGDSIFNISPSSWIRVSVLIMVSYLVQALIRLYQYNLRLAAFWDSRADAVLLAQRFGCDDATSFGELVASCAPDSYEFRPAKSDGLLERIRPSK